MEEEFYIYKVTSTQEPRDRAKGKRASFYGGQKKEREREAKASFVVQPRVRMEGRWDGHARGYSSCHQGIPRPGCTWLPLETYVVETREENLAAA